MGTHPIQDRPKPTVSFIVPALNEQDNLGPLVERLLAIERTQACPCEILIVDDASSDATYDVGARLAGLHPQVKVLRKELPRGIGRAVRHALARLRGRVAVVVMADGVDPLEEAVPQFAAKILAEGCHLALLSRYTTAADSASIPFSYKFFQAGFRFLTRYALGIKFRDTTYAFRAFDADFVRRLGLKSGGFEISPEITFTVIFAGGQAGEGPSRPTRPARRPSKLPLAKAFRGYSPAVPAAVYPRLTP